MKIIRTDAYAMIAGAVIITGWFAWSNVTKNAVPATDFFTVREINIPDFVQGTPFKDVAMVYDRTIKQEFLGTWVVEMHPAAALTTTSVCSNDGVRTYKVGEKPPETVTLFWFIDRECEMGAGQYVAEATYKIEAPGYPPKEYSAVSNIFTILPADVGQTYITKEQIEQLDKAKELLDNPLGAPTP